MKLAQLIKDIQTISIIGPESIDITGLKLDSKKVISGDMFFAVRGSMHDGHDYIQDAITRGATCVACEEIPQERSNTVTYVQVKNTEQVVGHIASAFFGNPSHDINIVGVTGTNGKTTVATLLYHAVTELGKKSGLVSTVHNRIGKESIPTAHTTPDAITLQSLFADMRDAGCTHVFMEVSSHALVRGRVLGTRFAGGIFTNLTQDHLDFHGTMDAYKQAKKMLFMLLDEKSFSLINADDHAGDVMKSGTKSSVVTYGIDGGDLQAHIRSSDVSGSIVVIDGKVITTPMVGNFNIYNLLAVFGTLRQLGFEDTDIISVLGRVVGARGRFEVVQGSDNQPTAIVDYAHTSDALKNILTTIHGFKKPSGKVICVMGCGGDRDRGKRPQMGRIGAQLSDHMIITSDNPRSEDPVRITEEIYAGVSDNDLKKVTIILDRKEAVIYALQCAKSDDIVLVAGKGHETYQDIQGVKHHFDDKEIIEEFLDKK
jgi:UDP-N-acetylmuramoyl-L-alanyl-D-glutamate--2,6-diaminopimelate ligase